MPSPPWILQPNPRITLGCSDYLLTRTLAGEGLSGLSSQIPGFVFHSVNFARFHLLGRISSIQHGLLITSSYTGRFHSSIHLQTTPTPTVTIQLLITSLSVIPSASLHDNTYVIARSSCRLSAYFVHLSLKENKSK